MSVPVVLALGGNLGDRLATLRAALPALAAIPGTSLTAVSPVYETDPVGGPPQPPYLNAVVLARTTQSPPALLAHTQAVEAALGRVRAERWGPRTLDVDLVVVDELIGDVSAAPALTLPHPRAHERAFVLAPWHDVDPEAVLPGRGRVADLLAGLEAGGLRRWGRGLG